MYSVSFYGVPVHTSRSIIFIHRQAARGVTHLWYSRGQSSPPYTGTGRSRQCSDRCPHSYTASLWYTHSHLQFNRKKKTTTFSLSSIIWLMSVAFHEREIWLHESKQNFQIQCITNEHVCIHAIFHKTLNLL